jgi:hypothetical protein
MAGTTTADTGDKAGPCGSLPPGASRRAVTVTPLYLPNYQKPFRVTTWNFLAKSDFTFNFENGWKLTQISDKADNSAVANTLAGQLQTMSAAEGAGPFQAQSTGASNAPQLRVILFRPIFDQNGYIKSFKEVGATETKSWGGHAQS